MTKKKNKWKSWKYTLTRSRARRKVKRLTQKRERQLRKLEIKEEDY